MDTVIRNGTLVTPEGPRAADVGIVGERIAAVGPDLRGAHEIDAAGCYVLPGAIDPHVHLHMPQGRYVSADDFASGTVAAALGGTTTVIDFVEPRPGESLQEALAQRRAEADGRVATDYSLHMTIPAAQADDPAALAEIPDLVAGGVPSFKLYLAYGGLRLDDAQLYRVMQAIAAAGGQPIVHCENDPVCDALRAQAVARGQTAPISHARTRPPRQEAEAMGRVIDIAALAQRPAGAGCPVYIVHVSCAASLARVQAARARGEPVTGETCPQYLLLTQDQLDQPGGELLICAPPLRSPADHAALWQALAAGDLDVLATDHCPFAAADKRGHADFTTIPGGLPGIEARLSLAHDLGQRHGLTLERWVAVCCANPARLFGLDRKGHLAPGYDADVVVFDPRRSVTLRPGATLHERVDWSPYAGRVVQGWPRDVLSRGRAVVRNGAFTGAPGWGRFVPRAPAG